MVKLKKLNGYSWILFFITFFYASHCMSLQDNFVYLEDIDPSIIQDVRYFTDNNFMGRRVASYEAPRCILTLPAALALAKVQKKLQQQSLGLKVFDCYRPQTAVNDFIRWSQDASDQKMKKEHYPNINKADVFDLGYVGAKSSHTKGSTVDLTIVQVKANGSITELEMGTHFDYFGEQSHYSFDQISQEEKENRKLLRDAMEADFIPYDKEWWHFTLKNEPFPETYFDFPVK